jgi:hypothetical protein
MWDPQHLTPLWAFTACYRDSFTFYHLFYNVGGYRVLIINHTAAVIQWNVALPEALVDSQTFYNFYKNLLFIALFRISRQVSSS